MTPDVLTAVYEDYALLGYSPMQFYQCSGTPYYPPIFRSSMLVTIYQTTRYHIPEGIGEIVLLTNFHIMVISKINLISGMNSLETNSRTYNMATITDGNI
jgi:hypothetical protein